MSARDSVLNILPAGCKWGRGRGRRAMTGEL